VIVENREDFFVLDSGSDTDVFEGCRENVGAVSSVRNTVVYDESHNGLQSVVSSRNVKLRANIFTRTSVCMATSLCYSITKASSV
jgi:hypothetical protein